MNKKQLEKMLRLADIKKPINEGVKSSAIEFIKSSADGNTYAIVRENRTYYIKSTETKNTLLESDFDYLGGLQNRTKNSFRAYDDAVTRLNLMFNDHNRVQGINEDIDMVNFSHVLNEEGQYVEAMDPRIQGAAASMRKDPSRDKKDTRDKFDLEEECMEEGCGDESGDELMLDGEKESIQEKRFVLKQPKPKVEKEPEMDFGGETEGGDDFDFGGGEDTGEEGGDDFDFGGEEEGDAEGGDDFDFGGEEGEDTEGGDEFDFEGEGEDTEGGEFDMEAGDGGDTIKDIQKTTGKLGQQLRDTEDISSDMQKWVAKSVISALDLNTMDDADKDDVINALESGGDSEESMEGGEDELDIDFMDDDMEYGEVEYAGGRTFEDGDYRGGEPELDAGEEILLDDNEDEGPGGYLGDYEGERYDDMPMKDVDMGIQDKAYLNMDPETMGGVDYMDDEDDVSREQGGIRYMTDDDMEPCGEGVDCGEMDEGMSKWNDADGDDGGMGWETNESVSYMGEDYSEEDIDRMFGNTDTYDMNNPQEAPAQPTTKPDTDAPAPTRPSKNPFSPPQRIRPGEEPRPKAQDDVDYMAAEPRPSQDPSEAPTIAPTKPGTDEPTPTRPSKTPFSPPQRIRPGEETRPKADYDDDVTFE